MSSFFFLLLLLCWFYHGSIIAWLHLSKNLPSHVVIFTLWARLSCFLVVVLCKFFLGIIISWLHLSKNLPCLLLFCLFPSFYVSVKLWSLLITQLIPYPGVFIFLLVRILDVGRCMFLYKFAWICLLM